MPSLSSFGFDYSGGENSDDAATGWFRCQRHGRPVVGSRGGKAARVVAKAEG
ncbi:hypothetical protein E1A91_A04G131900v1 [Gossypium mustelinum]|uniref:Uncharacterized protein n=1 Tax=Gossypium mustelinum TaxID=34275 RepID=A0A5D2ZNH8_GOSMU|nr:hypothetical protein E1A91_A04G131900v1 [Gossypium mustelinum]